MAFLFVGERRSQRALSMGVTWEDARLAAKVLHEALAAAGIDPLQQCYLNLFAGDEGQEINPLALSAIRSSLDEGWQVVALGRKVQRALTRLRVEHLPLTHPAARGSIRKSERYRAHVAAVLAGELP